MVGAISVVVIPAVMSKLGSSDSAGIRAMFWYMIVLTPIAVLVGTLRTPEIIAAQAPGPRFRFRDYLELVTDRNMSRILLLDLFSSLGPGWMAGVYVFFTRDYMHFDSVATNILLVANISAGLVGAPVIAWLATKISKHRAVMVAGASYSLAIIAMPLVSKGNPSEFAVASFVAGFMSAGSLVMTRAMTADVADEIRLRQGKEQSSLLFAMTPLTTKVAAGLSIFLAFGALSRVGYDPQLGHANSPEAIRGLAMVFAAGPVVLILLGVACLYGYRLTPARAAEVRRLLDARDAGEAQRVVETTQGVAVS